ncbi:hypothetical protein OEZ85_011541 [Tetradesmus obliquus]|uniref:Uncharacterized protein n=1 Tax=Tetradesmus obliquus TaxID=3088 RepID=A0ABY8TQN6_TETOB|nr:hypothetical protein OEZ85_011541 [Tetradesmus obliquus]
MEVGYAYSAQLVVHDSHVAGTPPAATSNGPPAESTTGDSVPSPCSSDLAQASLAFHVSLTDFYHIALTQAHEAARSYRSGLDARLSGADVQTSVKLDLFKTPEEDTAALKEFFLDTLGKHAGAEATTLAFMHDSMAALQALSNLAAPPKGTQLPQAAGDAAVSEYAKLLAAKAAASAAISPAPAAAAAAAASPLVPPVESPFQLHGEGSTVVLTVHHNGRAATEQGAGSYGQRTCQAAEAAANQAHFYAHTMVLLDTLRARSSASQPHASQPAGGSPIPAELFAIGLATEHIREGWQQPRLFKPVPLPGWHEQHQSFVFVTDAGPDHIKITVQDPVLLERGIVVHVEHIDRSETDDRSLMEAYRLPSHVTTARVRLHVGDLAPTSCFIGRPTFEGMSFEAQYPHDTSGNAFGALAEQYFNVVKKAKSDDFLFTATLLKAAHNTASACTAMFEAGVVDCKIAIENLTEQQAITFMRAVVANVRRDPDTQVLSAAFNINRPLYCESLGRVVGRKKKKQPGRSEADNIDELIERVVHIAAQGHFNKVTLDGSSELKVCACVVLPGTPEQCMPRA